MCGAVAQFPGPNHRVAPPRAGGQRSAWSQWTAADLIAAAAGSGWSQVALQSLLAAVGDKVKATRGVLWVPGREVHWNAAATRAADRFIDADRICEERLVEFCGTTGAGASVMLLWECHHPAPDAEDVVDDVGRLLVQAWEHTEEYDVPETGPRDLRLSLRAAVLRIWVGDVVMRHQAAGLLAERCDVSIADADHRVRATAERFQLSVSGFARHLCDAAQVGR